MSLGELLRFSKCGQSLHLFWRVLCGWEHGRGHLPCGVILRELQHSNCLLERGRVLSGEEHVRGHVSLGELLLIPRAALDVHLGWRVLSGWEQGRRHLPSRFILREPQHSR